VTSVVDLLGSAVVTRASLWLSRRRLRVIAYHGVGDGRAFGQQLEFLSDRFNVVTGADVLAAQESGQSLPERALWLTFDDGRLSVVETGLAQLERVGLPATIFVCPGLLPDDAKYWWSIVESALADGPVRFDGRFWQDQALITKLKTVGDDERRRFVAELATQLVLSHSHDPDPPMGRRDLQRWIDSGREVGNHTWDHPCMNRCESDEQQRQILASHEALRKLLHAPPLLFAYPNGDYTPESREVLAQAGYGLALAFDHRLSRSSDDPLNLSRLRLDSDASLKRTAAIVSGSHSAVLGLRTRLR
jgi:peptidoglycan/xylan/chitin deacetylase (PgdA/CDA1 family)